MGNAPEQTAKKAKLSKTDGAADWISDRSATGTDILR
jgi:hypothetical protein